MPFIIYLGRISNICRICRICIWIRFACRCRYTSCRL